MMPLFTNREIKVSTSNFRAYEAGSSFFGFKHCNKKLGLFLKPLAKGLFLQFNLGINPSPLSISIWECQKKIFFLQFWSFLFCLFKKCSHLNNIKKNCKNYYFIFINSVSGIVTVLLFLKLHKIISYYWIKLRLCYFYAFSIEFCSSSKIPINSYN